MPIVDLAPQPITGEMGMQPVESLENAPAYVTGASRDYGMDYSASPQAERPSVMGAAGRQSSEIISVFSRRDIGVSNTPEEGYGSAWDKIKGTKYEPHWRSFVDVNNSRMEAARKAQIDMEEEDRRTLAAAGIWGDLASMGMSLVSPTIFAPGGGLIRAIKGGYSVSRSALNIGLYAAGGVAAQEAALQGTQELRPWEESAIAVGGGFVLGGLLGAGAAKFLTRAEQRLAERGYRTLQQAMAPDAPRAGSVVAAPLADIASRMKAGEDVPVQEAIEAARVAALQARQTDMNAERLARIDDVIEPMVRRLEQTASASTADELLVAARTSFGADGARLVDEGAVTIVQSVEDLPSRPDGQAHPSDVRGVFDGNKAFIVADNVAPDEVKGVLLHEVGVHYGMQRMVGDANFRALLEDVTNRAQAGEARFAEALAAVPKETPAAHVAEEVLAYLVENAPELGIVQRVIAAVKQFVRQAFGGRFTGLSEGEIRQLAVASLRKWNPEARPADIRYARKPKGASDFTKHSKVKSVMYHGTGSSFDVFDVAKSDLGAHFGTIEQANKATGRGRTDGSAGPNVMPVYLDVRNPLRLKDVGSFHAEAIAPELARKGIIDKELAKKITAADWRGRAEYDTVVREAIKAAGYDSVVYKNQTEGAGDSYIVFSPSQIKSATGNSGAFDPENPDIRYSRGQTETPAFKKWSNNAPLITAEAAQTHQFKTGEKIVVEAFHGTKRPDRVGTKFLKKRATSGPMAYHTSSPELASSYALQKADTSLAYEDTDYANWFKFKPPGSRSTVGIDSAWFFLTPEQKQKIFDLAPRVMQDDDLNIVLGPEGHKTGTGGFDQHLAETRTSWDRRGNPLKALVEEWLNSGNLINDEGKFLDVLEKAGFPTKDINYDAPNAEFPAVYKNYIAMRNPLVTSDVPDTVVRALEDAAKKDRSRAQRGGADVWDKNTRTLREWVEMFKQEDNAYVWTSIPDKVTEVFKREGYDGIVDWSGKGGGERAPVYIPFEETQVKSAMGNRGTFDPTKNDIRYSRASNKEAARTAPAPIADALNNGDASVVSRGAAIFYSRAGEKREKVGHIIAYHGSPHDFDRFDMSKIGTGEGAQAYGHGLYFAEAEDVAKGYRDRIAGADWVDKRGVPQQSNNIMEDVVAQLRKDGMGLIDAEEAASFWSTVARDGDKVENLPGYASIKKVLDEKGIRLREKGSMYEVRINADPEHFLDWDKPLSEQPKAEIAVGRYLERALDEPGPIMNEVFEKFERGQMTGADVAKLVGADTAPLREAGIPGIKYLDAGSRGAGDGTRNYVVFDDKLVEIVRKYSRGGNRKAQIADQLEALSRALASVDDAEAFARTFAGRGAAAGAEFTDQPSLEDLTIAGKGARAYAAATRFMNPNLRANFRASASARADMQRLLENTIFQQMHLDNQTLGPAVETQMRAEYRARIIASAQAADNIWQEARKAGLPMTRRQFDEAVARAMRREDVGENDFVTRAAQSYRKEMFDHFKVMAQNTRGADGKPLLPEDLQVVGAPSYLTRMPNYERLTTDEMGFKRVVADYYEGVFRNEYQKAADATRTRIAALEQEIADLRMSPEDRVQTLDTIDKRLAEMEAMNAREVDLLAQINRLRQQATKAAESGNKKAAQTARDEASRLFASGGDTLREFLKERSALRSRQRRVDLNYAGLQEREDRIMQQLADIDDANLRAMNRLIDRGMKAERDMAKLDPAQKVEKIAQLREQFADVVARSEKAAQRLSDMSRKIAEDEIRALQKAMKDRAAGGMREATAGTVEAKAAAKSTEANKALAESIKRNAAAEAKRTEELSRIARRLDEAEALDPDGQILELKRAMNELAMHASNASLGRGENAQRLLDRAKKLDPKALDGRIEAITAIKRDIEREFYDRWEITRGGQGVDLDIANAKPRFTEYAQDVARQIFDHYTGRSENSGTVPDFAVPLATGPLKERTFNIPDQLIEPWLENDIARVAERYGRTMAAQIELTRKFGRADMRDQFARMAQEYRDLREQVGLAKDADEALKVVGQRPGSLDAFNAWRRKEDVNTVTKERILQWLSKDETEAAQDMRASRDLLLGRYKMEENQGDWATISRGLLAFNYIRAMGGAVIANLGDLYRSAMVHGLGRFMSDGIKPLITNLEGFRASVKEAQLAGQVGEAWLHQRLATFAEIGDPYGKGNAIDRLMENASRVASKWNGLQMFTDFSKSIASVTSQSRIMDAVLAGKEQKYLRFLGIDGFMEDRIKEQVRAHSRMIDGIRVAETGRWTDEEAVRAYRAALSKDVDSIVVERSVGDVPLFANTPTGRLILQFRTFNLAANQRVLLRGLQEDQARFVGSVVALASIGMLVSALRSWRGGEERWDKFKKSANNPGYLIAEGLDMSGIFTIPFEVANTVEKLTQPSGFSFNPIKTPMMAAFPGRSQQGESTRFASRDPIGALLGPSASLPMTAAKALGGDFKAASQLLPFGTYPGMREALQAISGDSPYGF